MKPQKIYFLLAVLLSMVGAKALAGTNINGIYYYFNSNNKTAEVTYGEEYTFNDWGMEDYQRVYYTGYVDIPQSVTYNREKYTVTSIGREAFRDCTNLSGVSLPNSITSIGGTAFDGCFCLNYISIPDNVTSIGGYAFRNCSSLTSITIPNSVTSIGDFAFYGCSGLTSISIGNSVESIGIRVFESCSSLTSITIPNSVTSIGDYAFDNCSSLTSIIIPNSVTSIGDVAFGGSGLTSVTIPNSVTSIGKSAFTNCSGLTSIKVETGNVTYDSRNNCNAIIETATNTLITGCKNTIIPNSVTSIGNSAFSGCSGLTSITIPNSVTSIGKSAFSDCSGLTSIIIPNCVTNIGEYAFYNCSSMTSVTIPNSVTTIGYAAFWKSNLTDITIPNSVTNIGQSAFSETPWYNNKSDGMVYAGKVAYKYKGTMAEGTQITLKEGTLGIAGGAFQFCYGLYSVSLPQSVINIGRCAFNCCGLISITIPNSVIGIGDFAFHNCSNLTDVTIGTSVKSIGGYAFSDCSELTEVTFEDDSQLMGISYDTFSNCSSLTSITIPNSVTSIGNSAFSGCSGLTSINIPEGVTTVGDYAFFNCNSLTSVTIDKQEPLTISSSTFSNRRKATLHVPYGCSSAYRAADYWKEFKEIVEMAPPVIIEFADANVKTICVENWDVDDDDELSEGEAAAVTDIGRTFKGNKQISSFDELQYFTGLTSIEDNAFRGCTGLTSIIIPDNVTSIGDDAFSGCTRLSSVTIPASVTSIGDFALSNCSSLVNVYCYAEAVPSASADTFDGTNIGAATLYVPKASLALYKTRAPWSGFGTIVPIDGFMINDETTSFSIASEESGQTVTFTHDFNGEWEALCLPFAIDYNAIKADFDLAEIDGIVQNDDNNDGIADITVLSIMGFKEQMTEPNTPYLIRAKNAGKQTIIFEDVTFYPTVSETLESSSTSIRYEFTGSYNTLGTSDLANRYVVQGGELVKGASSLAPCRWYMTATAKKGALNLPAKIRILLVEDVITGVSPLGETEEGAVIYNLAGQRLSKPQKGINIQNSKKIIIK